MAKLRHQPQHNRMHSAQGRPVVGPSVSLPSPISLNLEVNHCKALVIISTLTVTRPRTGCPYRRRRRKRRLRSSHQNPRRLSFRSSPNCRAQTRQANRQHQSDPQEKRCQQGRRRRGHQIRSLGVQWEAKSAMTQTVLLPVGLSQARAQGWTSPAWKPKQSGHRPPKQSSPVPFSRSPISLEDSKNKRKSYKEEC